MKAVLPTKPNPRPFVSSEVETRKRGAGASRLRSRRTEVEQ
jgi:hypothetical protein